MRLTGLVLALATFGCTHRPLGFGDMAVAPDLAPSVDLALLPDLAAGTDLSRPAPAMITSSGLTAFAPGQLDDHVVSFPVPTPEMGQIPPARFAFNCSLPKAGTYQLSVAFADDPNGWSVWMTWMAPYLMQKQITTPLAPGMAVNEQVAVYGADPSGDATVNVTVMTPAPTTPHQPSQEELDQSDAYGVLSVTLHALR